MLPTTYQQNWREYLRDRPAIAAEYRGLLGDDYEAQIEEDAIARLISSPPAPRTLSPLALNKRMDQESSGEEESEREVRQTLQEDPSRSHNSSKASRRSDPFPERDDERYIPTPIRVVPDQLGDRNRGRRLTDIFAPSQFAQAQMLRICTDALLRDFPM